MFKFIATVSISIVVISLAIMFLVEIPVKTKPYNNIISNVQGGMGGDFVLHNVNGNIVDAKQFRGKYMLIYFGFTFCPDICPTSLLEMSGVIENLGDKVKYLQPIFITVDPNRDTASQLKEYFTHFNRLILPLTGTAQEITDVAAKFKVYYAVSMETKNDHHNYLIDHSSFFYLVGPDGKFIKYYNSKILASDMSQDILTYLDK